MAPATRRSLSALLQKHQLPLGIAQRRQVASVGPVEELLARRFFGIALKVGQPVVAVQVHLVGHRTGREALEQLCLDVRLAGRGQQRGQHVLVRADLVDDGARLDDAGPLEDAGHTVAALPVGVLLAAEGRRAAVGPAQGFGAVVSGIHENGVVRNTQVIELLEELADVAVVLDQAIR